MMYLHRVARRKATPVSLENLFRFGLAASHDRDQRLRNAQFLHGELQIRIAQRVVELEALPLGLPETRPVQDVISWYTDYFERVAECEFPMDEQGEENFTDLLSFILQDNNEVIETTSRGVLEVRSKMKGFSVDDQRQIDRVLNRFYLARIGLRFLIEHHLTSRIPREGFSGIIQSNCSPVEVMQKAATEARRLCEYHKGVAPKIEFTEIPRSLKSSANNKITFTYVPEHILYMVTEVLKNSVKAVADKWGPVYHDEDLLPPIKATIVEGKNDVTIKISDEGGGMERSSVPLIWSYLHSTAEDPRIQEDLLHNGRARTVLAGYGVGLPLSRLYARYFGGDLDIKSLEGFGTDAFLYLPRLGHNCENLPEVVHNSPAQKDSSLPRGNSQMFFFGDRKSWQENVALGQSQGYHSTEDPKTPK